MGGRVLTTCLLVICGGAMCAPAIAFPPGKLPPSPPAAFNAAEVAPFFEAMATRRVSIDSVGDSNHHGVLQSGDPALGYFEALGGVLEAFGYQWYGAAAQSCGRGSRMTWRAKATMGVNEADASELPTGLQPYMDDLSKGRALRSTAGDPFGAGAPNRGVTVNPQGGFFSAGEQYTATAAFGAYPTGQGAGGFRWGIYEGGTGGALLSESAWIASETGAWGVTIPASLGVTLSDDIDALKVGHSAESPDHTALYMGLTRDSATTGFTLSTFWAEGGAGVTQQGDAGVSWRDFMDDVSSPALELYLKMLVIAQNDAHKMLLLNVALGMNDRTGDPAVWEADLTACLAAYQQAFDVMIASEPGWTGELYVLLWPGPHQRLEDGAYILALRDSARNVASARARTAVIDVGQLGIDAAYLQSQPGLTFTGFSSKAHLLNAGYAFVTWFGLAALIEEMGVGCPTAPGGVCPETMPPSACVVDVDNDGASTIEDLYAAHQGAPADLNCDAAIDWLDAASLARALRSAELADVSAAR